MPCTVYSVPSFCSTHVPTIERNESFSAEIRRPFIDRVRERMLYPIYLSLDLFLPIILHIPFDALNPFRHYLLISYMLLLDVGIWCNRALCVETAHSTYFTATSPLVSVLFVPSLRSYYFSRKFLFFSHFLCNSACHLHAYIVMLNVSHNLDPAPINTRLGSYQHTGTCAVSLHSLAIGYRMPSKRQT